MAKLTPKYKRILIKVSGEYLMGSKSYGFDLEHIKAFISQIKDLCDLDIEIGLVIGAGNLFRGKQLAQMGIDPICSDQVGMLATIMNAVILRDLLAANNLPVKMVSALPVPGIIKQYNRISAIKNLQAKNILIFAGGTGNPLVTTDSAASLRAIEIKADLMIKATNVDGVYNSDPKVNKDAKLYRTLGYQEAIDNQLKVMDLQAFLQCQSNRLPILVCNISTPKILNDAILGENVGTLVK